MSRFTVQEGGQRIAEVEVSRPAAIEVTQRPPAPAPSRLPPGPLPIPPPGFIVINEREAQIFGLGSVQATR